MALRRDKLRLAEHAHVGAGVRDGDVFGWRCHTRVEKYGVDDYHAGRDPADVLEIPGNLLLYGGADVMWRGLSAGLSASTGTAFTKYDNTNAVILFGDSTAAAAVTQTDLQAIVGGTHRLAVAMDATFPTHTTGVAGSTSSKILYKATLTSAMGNFSNGIREWGIGNRLNQSVPYTGRLLNRKVQNLGTKTTLGIWVATMTLSLA